MCEEVKTFIRDSVLPRVPKKISSSSLHWRMDAPKKLVIDVCLHPSFCMMNKLFIKVRGNLAD